MVLEASAYLSLVRVLSKDGRVEGKWPKTSHTEVRDFCFDKYKAEVTNRWFTPPRDPGR